MFRYRGIAAPGFGMAGLVQGRQSRLFGFEQGSSTLAGLLADATPLADECLFVEQRFLYAKDIPPPAVSSVLYSFKPKIHEGFLSEVLFCTYHEPVFCATLLSLTSSNCAYERNQRLKIIPISGSQRCDVACAVVAVGGQRPAARPV